MCDTQYITISVTTEQGVYTSGLQPAGFPLAPGQVCASPVAKRPVKTVLSARHFAALNAVVAAPEDAPATLSELAAQHGVTKEHVRLMFTFLPRWHIDGNGAITRRSR